jgi:vacuolar protein-sorting-associated protein 4
LEVPLSWMVIHPTHLSTVMVKEALMEPVRRCQRAKQFILKDGKYYPCEKYPSCCYCPPKLTTDPPGMKYNCEKCGARRMSLWDVNPEMLDAPPVEYRDFQMVMNHSHSTVSQDELKKFQEWTAMFGQDGA